MKVKILSATSDPSRPFAHLEPIVQSLVDDGNQPVERNWFSLDQDGWHCLLKNPIDFDLLESKFEFPNSISLSRQDDAILDTLTWVEIKGGFGAVRK